MIFVYLIPVYILLAIPLIKWTMKNFSSDVELSKDELSAFNSDEGEVRKPVVPEQAPDLNDGALTVRYRSGGSSGGSQEEMNWGYRPGYLSQFVADNLSNPKAIEDLFNNRWTVKGFFARASVKRNLAGAQALQAFLESDPAAEDFFGLPAVQGALRNPKVLDAVAGSDLAKYLLDAPAAKALMKDRAAVKSVLDNSPQLAALLRRPDIKSAVLNNPQTADLARTLGWR